ncbi:hypothetical protein GQ43DRAFT_430519 [Delitschia confertaspora ATCC 74209]|uniref:Nuclear pore assembly and biogenesis-domain-containing protein n=1 Tax=Delitschia confertaspora ATCC 74209 TaxID=1513339 RepID=A0A9P4MR79_9PLEO|nr:hypothetical protein GQ43DRAFT_430519 [Delitschia confertaspora ATCC 74209]
MEYMNYIQDYIHFAPKLLPPSVSGPLTTIITSFLAVSRTASTHLFPLLTRLTTQLTTQPDLASVLLLLALLFLSFKVLDMAYRAVIFWVRLAVRLTFWGGLGVIGLWVWSRGMEGAIEDAQMMAQYWWGQFQEFQGDVEGEKARLRNQAEKKGYYGR